MINYSCKHKYFINELTSKAGSLYYRGKIALIIYQPTFAVASTQSLNYIIYNDCMIKIIKPAIKTSAQGIFIFLSFYELL
jgi:hypothetical protein